MNVSNLKAVLAALFLIVWIVIGVVTMLVARLLRSRLVYRFPLLFHGVVARLFGLQVEVVGEVGEHRPIVFASNHISYMDVFVLGGQLEGAFVAKSEVASWPVFGKLAKLQNTMFLERRRQRAAEQVVELKDRLGSNTNLILCPEGTSTDGTGVAPYRSSLFAAFEGMWVQPVTVAYLTVDGVPMTQSQRDAYAWYLPDPVGAPQTPNKPFAAHFFAGLGLKGRAQVKILLHEPVLVAAGQRKAVAAACERSVREGLVKLLAETEQHEVAEQSSPA